MLLLSFGQLSFLRGICLRHNRYVPQKGGVPTLMIGGLAPADPVGAVSGSGMRCRPPPFFPFHPKKGTLYGTKARRNTESASASTSPFHQPTNPSVLTLLPSRLLQGIRRRQAMASA